MFRVSHFLFSFAVAATLAALTGCSAQPSSNTAQLADHGDGVAAMMRYSDAAQAVVDANRCARKVAENSAGEVIAIAQDWGVDWPDTFDVELVEEVWSPVRTDEIKWRVAHSDFAFLTRTTQRCRILGTERLSTVSGPVEFRSTDMNALAALGTEYLGQEFFGHDNIGGSLRFTVNETDNELSPIEMVKTYYSEWQDLNADVELVTDVSEAGLRQELETIGIKAHESDGDDDNQIGAVAAEFLEKLTNALAANRSFVVVRGSWFGSGIGDPMAGFIAIVAPNSGKVLILEQGYVD